MRDSKLIRLNQELHKQLKQMAREERLTIRALAEKIIDEWLNSGEELSFAEYFTKKYGKA
jgi:predicted DNA-binding ribbon-helix-helix protein